MLFRNCNLLVASPDLSKMPHSRKGGEKWAGYGADGREVTTSNYGVEKKCEKDYEGLNKDGLSVPGCQATGTRCQMGHAFYSQTAIDAKPKVRLEGVEYSHDGMVLWKICVANRKYCKAYSTTTLVLRCLGREGK